MSSDSTHEAVSVELQRLWSNLADSIKREWMSQACALLDTEGKDSEDEDTEMWDTLSNATAFVSTCMPLCVCAGKVCERENMCVYEM